MGDGTLANRDGDFADFSAFADFFFSASNLLHFCGFLQFRALIREREREMRKKCLQNNPNRASESERNAEKLLTKNVPNRASGL